MIETKRMSSFSKLSRRASRSTIESFDHVVIELLRHGRTNVTVRRVPDADHGFATPDDHEQMGILQALDAAVAWAMAEVGA